MKSIVCAGCQAKLLLKDENATALKCPKCGAKLKLASPTGPKPTPAAKRAEPTAAARRAAEPVAPRTSKRDERPAKRPPAKTFPWMLALVGGGGLAAVAVIVGITIVFMSSGQPVAKKNAGRDNPIAQTKPPKVTSPPIVPPKEIEPKKQPPIEEAPPPKEGKTPETKEVTPKTEVKLPKVAPLPKPMPPEPETKPPIIVAKKNDPAKPGSQTPPNNLPLIEGQPLAAWVAQLKAPEEAKRLQAVRTLGKAGPVAAWALPQMYETLLTDESARVRMDMAWSIGALGPYAEAAVPGFIALLGDEKELPGIRSFSAAALAKIGPAAKPAIPTLAAALTHSSVGNDAAKCLAVLGPESVAPFIAGMQKVDPNAKATILQWLSTVGIEGREFAPAVASLIDDPSPTVRKGVVQALEKMRATGPEVAVAMAKAVGDSDPTVRAWGFNALRQLKREGATLVPHLIPLLGHADPKTKQDAAEHLGRLGPVAVAAVPDLKALARDPSVAVKAAAAVALAKIGADPATTIPALIDVLGKGEDPDAVRVILALALYGPAAKDAIPGLVALVKMGRDPLAAEARETLSAIGKPAVPAALALVNEKDGELRASGAKILAGMPPVGVEVVEPLRTALFDKTAARWSVSALTRQGVAARPAVPDLFGLLTSPMQDVRQLSAAGVGAIGVGDDQLPALTRLATDPVPETRKLAAMALAGSDKGGGPLLTTLTRDADPMVKQFAIDALGRWQKRDQFADWRKAIAANDSPKRHQAAIALLQVDRIFAEALPAATEALVSVDPATRQKAAETLAKVGMRTQVWEVHRGFLLAMKEFPREAQALEPSFRRADSRLAIFLGYDLIPPMPKVAKTPPIDFPMPGAIVLRDPANRAIPQFDLPTLTAIRFLSPAAGGKIEFVAMDRAVEPMGVRAGEFRGILARELVRQAFLIAARDELGLYTRDQALGESVADAKSFATKSTWTLSVSFLPDHVRIALARGSDPKRDEFWTRDVKYPKRERFDYVRFAEALEPIARTEWPEVLRKAGIDDPGVRPLSAAATPPEVASRLSILSHPAQFGVLRQLHETMRTAGESPALTADLVRAYANLGILTETHWSAADRVCKARALLYAQRLAARNPKTPLGLWHRAYAAALTGLESDALADLRDADALAAKGAARPQWLGPLLNYCRREPVKKGVAAVDSFESLLQYLAVDMPQTPAATVLSARAAVAANPDCFRAYDSMCGPFGVTVVNRASTEAIEAFAKRFPVSLRDVLRFPADIPIPAAGEDGMSHADERALLTALAEAGSLERDRSELSWASLAWMTRELRIAQVYRRVSLLKRTDFDLESPASFAERHEALIADHPYKLMIDILVAPEGKVVPLVKTISTIVDAGEVSPAQSAGPLAFYVNRHEVNGENRRGDKLAAAHLDHITRDLRASMRTGVPTPAMVRRLLLVNPFDPIARALFVDREFAAIEKFAAAWEAEPSHPIVLMALGKQYAKDKRLADAERCFKAYLVASPDSGGYHALANLYKEQNRLELWEDTLCELLQQEHFGLYSMRNVRANMAEHFMAKKNWKKAIEITEPNAKDGEDWAKVYCMRCLEELKEWAPSEEWAKAMNNYYHGTGEIERGYRAWYDWCARNQRGDLEKAAGRVADIFRNDAIPKRIDDAYTVAHDAFLSKTPARAFNVLKAHLETAEDPLLMPFVALLAHELGDTAFRDSTFKASRFKFPNDWLMTEFQTALKDRKGRLDRKAIDAALARDQKGWIGARSYFVGRYLELHNERKEAIPYYQRALDDVSTPFLFRELARAAVHAGK